MTTLHGTTTGAIAYSKGAATMNLRSPIRCASEFVDWNDAWPGRGLRVLAVARKSGASIEDAAQQMTLLGLVAMMDPPRAEARGAVQTCQAAGIRPVMITGDHPLTASTVAKEIGLLHDERVVSGPSWPR